MEGSYFLCFGLLALIFLKHSESSLQLRDTFSATGELRKSFRKLYSVEQIGIEMCADLCKETAFCNAYIVTSETLICQLADDPQSQDSRYRHMTASEKAWKRCPRHQCKGREKCMKTKLGGRKCTLYGIIRNYVDSDGAVHDIVKE